MDAKNVALREAEGSGLRAVELLLERNDLPVADVRSGPGDFYEALDGTERVGIGGLEVYGSDALLRSVVVVEDARGRGYGTAICEALEDQARAAGAETVYLLTTTAADFFAARGYEEMDRDAPPGTITATSEFADLCPETATCMRRDL